jgi:hypothetical protein
MLTLLTLLISIFVDASTSIDTFQSYVNHSCAFDYKRVSVTSQSECKEKCFEDTKCLTCTYSNNNCYLSSTDQHTLFDTSSTISRKIDRSQCGSTTTCIGSQECSRMDSVTATCTDGFGCGCSCTVNADCQQNQMDLGCNQCSDIDPLTGIGRCVGTTTTIKPRPPPSATCSYPPTNNTRKNLKISTNLDLIFIFDTSHTWSKSGSQFASALINNLTIADGYGRVGFIRAGVVQPAGTSAATAAGGAAAAFVNLTTKNGTLNRILSLAPPTAATTLKPVDSFVDAMALSSSMFEAGRQAVLIVVSESIPVDACATVDPVSWSREQNNINIISVSTGNQTSSSQRMIGTTSTSSVAIGANPTYASKYVIGLLQEPLYKSLKDHDVDRICGRKCSGNLHCAMSTQCGLCNGNGICGNGSCKLPIPPKPVNTNVSAALEMVLVVDVGNPASSLETLSMAGEIGLNFSFAKVRVITYSDTDHVKVSDFLTNEELSSLTCGETKCGGGGTGGLDLALQNAGNLLNQSSSKWQDNTTGPLQVVVVVSSQVRASLESGSYGQNRPVVSARALWSDGIQVFSLISNQLCTYGAQGFSESFECGDANMLGNIDLKNGSPHTIDLRTTDISIASSMVSNAIVDLHRTLPACDWTEFKNRKVALAFREFIVDSQGTCIERCCLHRRCKATTVVPTRSSAVLCRLHDRWQIPFTIPSTNSNLFHKHDEIGCNRYCLTNDHCEFHGCGKCNFLFNKCDHGYKCGCSCSEDTDCDTSSMDLSCSKCVSKDQSGYGRCRSKFCGQDCKKDSDCSDAQSCPRCDSTSNKCVPKIVPDPIPGNCVLPFPGHPHKNCSLSLDLMLLLDGSGSIGQSAWKKILHFTAGIGLNFTTGDDFMNYGVIEFSDSATTFLPLTSSNASFQQVVATLPYMGLSTNTFSGFQTVEKEFNARSRPNAFKVMIILTDGEWNNGGDPTPISKRLKENHTKIFTIAVGDAATDKVQALASLPLSKYYYNVSNEQFLPKILHKMILSMCDREEDGTNNNDDKELVASKQLTEQRYMPLSPSLFVKRRLDWSNLTATTNFDCGTNDTSRWIVVENSAMNPMRIRTCSLNYNKEVCKGSPKVNETGYTQCSPNGNPLAFIPAKTTVLMRVPINVTYIVALYCINNPGRSIHCLSTPTPLEFYGPAMVNSTKHGFPINGLIIPNANKRYCSVDVDCEINEKCDTASHMCN